MQRLALLAFVFLVIACGSTKLHVVEPPARRLGGTFAVKEIEVDNRVNAEAAREDAALLARELRGALGVIARDGAGDERFVVEPRLVRYDEAMVVTFDVLDQTGRRVMSIEISAAASKRGWTGAARETARYDIVTAFTNFVRSER